MSAEGWARVYLLDQLAGAGDVEHDLDTAQFDECPNEKPGRRYDPRAALAWTDALETPPAQLAADLLTVAADRG